jgi:hypothetical protein
MIIIFFCAVKREQLPLDNKKYKKLWNAAQQIFKNAQDCGESIVFSPTGDYRIPATAHAARSNRILSEPSSTEGLDAHMFYWSLFCDVVVDLSDRSLPGKLSCTCAQYLLKKACPHILVVGIVHKLHRWPAFVFTAGKRTVESGTTHPATTVPGEALRRIALSSRAKRGPGRPRKFISELKQPNNTHSSSTLRRQTETPIDIPSSSANQCEEERTIIFPTSLRAHEAELETAGVARPEGSSSSVEDTTDDRQQGYLDGGNSHQSRRTRPDSSGTTVPSASSVRRGPARKAKRLRT